MNGSRGQVLNINARQAKWFGRVRRHRSVIRRPPSPAEDLANVRPRYSAAHPHAPKARQITRTLVVTGGLADEQGARFVCRRRLAPVTGTALTGSSTATDLGGYARQ